MAVTINASTSAGLVQTADTSGVLALQTAGTTAVTVDASQNVGVGTASPTVKLDLSSTTNGVIARFKGTSTYGQVVADNGSSTGGGVFVSKQNGVANSYFGVEGAVLGTTSSNTGIYNDVAGTSINFYTGGSTALRFSVNSVGGVKAFSTIGVGNATPSTSGAGITFPPVLDPSSNANTLDDYEEGTWTPAFAFSTSGSVTYSTQAGYYRKVGSLVFVECNIIIASVSSPTGNVTVNNLPFTVSSSTENVGSMAIGIVRNLVNAKPDIKAYCANGSTQILFPVNDTISGSSELQGSDLKASTLIYVSGCFITD